MMKKFMLYISLAILLISCGDILESMDEQGEADLILIKTLHDGETINAKHFITFEIKEPQEKTTNPDGTTEPIIIDLAADEDTPETARTANGKLELEFNLFDRDDNHLMSVNLPVAYNQENTQLFGELFPLELNTGQYFLVISFYQGTELLEETELTFFYTTASFEIRSIESFPPVIYPNITVDLQADLLIPPGADPFLRWNANGKYLDTGLFSSGLGQTRWTAPPDAGIYSLSLELFPVKPVNFDALHHVSSIVMDVNLFVSDQAKPRHRNLFPEDSYYTLFHFSGDPAGQIRGNSQKWQPLEAEPAGNPILVIASDDLAYSLGPGKGLLIPAFILPVAEEKLAPFTLNLGIQPLTTGAGLILSTTNLDSSFRLQLSLDNKNQYTAQVQFHGEEFLLASGITAGNERILLSLSCLPQEKGYNFIWYENEHFRSAESLSPGKKEVTGAGSSLIGGDNSFTGLIDELGVYYRNNSGRQDVNANLYRYSLSAGDNPDILFATGFDGLYPEEGSRFTGNVILKESFANLSPGASFVLPLPEAEKQLSFNLNLLNREQAALRVLQGENEIFRWQGTEILQGNNLVATLPGLTENMSLQIKKSEISITSFEKPVKIKLPVNENKEELSLEVRNNSRQEPLKLESASLSRSQREE